MDDRSDDRVWSELHARTGIDDGRSDAALKRVWRAGYFSWWMTRLLHTVADAAPFERQVPRGARERRVLARDANGAGGELRRRVPKRVMGRGQG